jgi:ParB family chromosome partitioning protein
MQNLELKGLKTLQALSKSLETSQEGEGDRLNYFTLPIGQLSPGKFQPRRIFSEDAILELANSIKQHGIIQPLIVRKIDAVQYEIIAGERRWRAAKLANLKVVPVIEQEIPDKSALAFALIENVQREDLNPLEHAVALERLRNEFSMTHDEVAEIMGCSRSTITNLLRLLTLTDEVKELLLQNKLDMGHARALLAVEEKEQIVLARQIITKKLSVREAEKLIRNTKYQPQAKRNASNILMNTRSMQVELSRVLSMDVRIRMTEEGEGSLTVNFTSQGELQWLFDRFKNV